MLQRSFGRHVIALSAVLSLASSPVLAQSPAAQRGPTFVRVHCAQCHAIDVSDSPLAIAPRSAHCISNCRLRACAGAWPRALLPTIRQCRNSGSNRIRSRMSLHICRHLSPNAKLTDSCAVAFREPLHLAENRLEFDLDQDSRLRSAQQYLMGGASRVAPCAGAEKGTGSLCMNGHRRVRCARLRSEIDYHRTCLCDCGDVGWWFRPMSCSKPPALARIRWNI